MAQSFHAGELAVQAQAGVQHEASRLGKGIRAILQPAHQEFFRGQQLAVASSVSADRRVWASLLTGAPGFLQAIDEQTVLITVAPSDDDPLWTNLQEQGQVGLLVIDLAMQKRVRVNGIGEKRADGGLLLHVQQAFGNCPRYIQVRQPNMITAPVRPVSAVKHGTVLTEEYQAWITHADTFFIATAHPDSGADASHRGGNPGFVRILDPHRLAWPDYNGNGMFQTLGNITVNPQVGLLFVDFRGGRTLQLRGTAKIVWDPSQVATFVGAERVIEFSCEHLIEAPAASLLRWQLVKYSHHNPA